LYTHISIEQFSSLGFDLLFCVLGILCIWGLGQVYCVFTQFVIPVVYSLFSQYWPRDWLEKMSAK